MNYFFNVVSVIRQFQRWRRLKAAGIALHPSQWGRRLGKNYL